MRAILLISHGSRSRQARLEVEGLARRLRRSTGLKVEIAFLEVEKPTIPEGVAACVRRGATQITVLLNFLNSGNHVLVDVPAILKEEQLRHKGVTIRITGPVGQHPRITDLFIEMAGRGAKR